MRSLISLIIFLIFTIHSVAQESNKAKNIILLIGDGMGLTQVSTRVILNDKPSNFERFLNIGLIKTTSSSHKITDSGAGATAFSIGMKSYNGSIGVGPDSLPRQSVCELLSKHDYSTGVISTSSITHATPASFYAHVKSRKMEEKIASQLIESEIDFFAGGGKEFFFKRKDEINLGDEAISKGFVIDTISLESFDINSNNKLGFLFADDGMPRMLDGRGDFLQAASEKGIEYLSKNESGFFLMIEGSQIDWGGHANDHDYIRTEMEDFDKVISAVLDFAEKDGETLVIVLADHETGGYSLGSKDVKGEDGKMDRDYSIVEPRFSTGGHTCTMIPVFAYGPGSELFRGIYENHKVYFKMLEALGKLNSNWIC